MPMIKLPFSLNGFAPPVGTLLPGIEPLVVIESNADTNSVVLTTADNRDFMAANMREPRQVHSVYEYSLILRRRTVFGMAKVMG